MWQHLLLIGLISGFTFFAGLGRPAIADSDEAFYAEASREMIETGDWLTPRYNYENRFQKPILYYWLASTAYLIGGIDETSARLPSALAGLGLAWLAYGCGRRWLGSAVGLTAGLIVATSFGYFSMARQSLPDLPLAFFTTLAIWAFFEVLPAPDGRRREPASSPRPATAWWAVIAGLALGGGFLMKGPVIIAVAGLVVGLALLGEAVRDRRPWHRALLAWMPWRALAVAGAVFVLVAAPWFAGMVLEHGPAYLHRFFVAENVERFATDRYNEPRPVWFYVPVAAAGMLPWSPLALLWLPGVADLVRRRRIAGPLEWRLMIWALAPLVFFTASIGKQPRYILPILPPLAILLARSILARTGTKLVPPARPSRLLTAGAVLSGLTLLVLGALIYRAEPLLRAVNPEHVGAAGFIVAAAGLAVMAVAAAGRVRVLVPTLVGAATATLVALQFWVLSTPGPEPVERIARSALTHRQPGEPLGPYQVFVRNLVFYTHTKQLDLYSDERLLDILREPGPELLVLERAEVDRLRTQGFELQVLDETRYVNPAQLKIGMLLWPDPRRDVATVQLVRTAGGPEVREPGGLEGGG